MKNQAQAKHKLENRRCKRDKNEDKMTKENLIPMNKRTKSEHLALSSKGGKSKSQAKKFAAHIREIKKRGITDKIHNEIRALMLQPDVDMIGMLILLDEFKEHKMTSAQEINLINLRILWAKLWFGDASHKGRKELNGF